MSALLTPETEVAWETGELTLRARLVVNSMGLETWNGWVLPYFDVANIEKLRAHNNALPITEVDHFEWAGHTLLEQNGYGDTERIGSIVDDAGVERWSAGAWAWTWQRVDPDACLNEEPCTKRAWSNGYCGPHQRTGMAGAYR